MKELVWDEAEGFLGASAFTIDMTDSETLEALACRAGISLEVILFFVELDW